MFFDQGFSIFEAAGVGCGIVATLIICLWDEVKMLITGQNKDDEDVKQGADKPLLENESNAINNE